MNWLFFPTLVLALICFWLGQESLRRLERFSLKLATLAFFSLLALPGLLYSFYYLHLFDHWIWFYELRAFHYSELLAALCGLAAGGLSSLLSARPILSRPFIIALLCLGLFIPYFKPLIAPLNQTSFSDSWKDGICLQSTPSSCGAASAATLFRSFGITLSEAEIARECHTYSGGTESWYLCRAFRARGFRVSFVNAQPPEDPITAPCIAGVRMAGAGHFIPILENKNDLFLTGDPLRGKASYTPLELNRAYNFTGFFMCINKE